MAMLNKRVKVTRLQINWVHTCKIDHAIISVWVARSYVWCRLVSLLRDLIGSIGDEGLRRRDQLVGLRGGRRKVVDSSVLKLGQIHAGNSRIGGVNDLGAGFRPLLGRRRYGASKTKFGS